MYEKNSVFSAMAATAGRVLAEHGEKLAEVASVHIASSTTGTHPACFRPVISLLCASAGGSEVAVVTRWADTFGAPVRLIRYAAYVQVSTEFEVDGHPVVVWDHITPSEADTIASALGERLETVLDIDPGRAARPDLNGGNKMPTAHQARRVSQEARNARAGQAEREREQAASEQARQEDR